MHTFLTMSPKENIIRCAFDILCENGYDRTSVREIAKAASVNAAMINYYFGGKEELFAAVIQDRFNYLRGIFTEMARDASQSAIERIDSIIDHVIDRKFSNQKFHYLLHNELALKQRPELRDKIGEYIMMNVSPVKKIIEQGIRSGEFNRVDVELTVSSIIGTIHYLLISDTLCQNILGKDNSFTPFENKPLKKRVKKHLKALVRSYLLKENEMKDELE